jgi:pimeloyl-ACP methyl ester carboxylesterase
VASSHARLAQRFTVLAVDLRGVGGSAPSAGGYAAVELARDVFLLIERLGLGPVHLAGHDIGALLPTRSRANTPEQTETTTVLEVPLAGIEPLPGGEIGAALWHVPFHLTPELPEALVAGRQETYFRYFFDQFTIDNTVISAADVRHYAHAYRDPGHLRSAFEFYRAMPANEVYNSKHTESIDVPLLLVGGEHLVGPLMPRMAEAPRANYGWSSVDVHTVRRASTIWSRNVPRRLPTPSSATSSAGDLA